MAEWVFVKRAKKSYKSIGISNTSNSMDPDLIFTKSTPQNLSSKTSMIQELQKDSYKFYSQEPPNNTQNPTNFQNLKTLKFIRNNSGKHNLRTRSRSRLQFSRNIRINSTLE